MDRPDAAELIAVALARFRAEILPIVPPDRRLTALMIANALGIAERGLTAPQDGILGETGTGFVADLRRGRWDGDAEVHRLLLRDAKARVAIANPRYF
jgi:hypothetical protein